MKISNKTARLYVLSFPEVSYRLPPGVSEHADALGEQLLDAVQRGTGTGKCWETASDMGHLAIVEEDVPVGQPACSELTTYNADMCQALVRAETSRLVLNTWLGNEKRKTIKALIEKRLKELS